MTSQKTINNIYYKVRLRVSKYIPLKDLNYLFDTFSKNPVYINGICSMANLYNECIPRSKKFTTQSNLNKILKLLGEANFEASFAYTMYDYIRDGKIRTESISNAISVSNLLIQKSITTFMHLSNSSEVCKDVLRLCNIIDEYYLTYLNQQPTFKKLSSEAYRKSIGLAIVPLLVTSLAGHSHESTYYKQTLSFFKHYLSARQLSDDLDDIEKDFKHKIITSATILIKSQNYNLENISKKLKKVIHTHLLKAERSLARMPGFNIKYFTSLYVLEC